MGEEAKNRRRSTPEKRRRANKKVKDDVEYYYNIDDDAEEEQSKTEYYCSAPADKRRRKNNKRRNTYSMADSSSNQNQSSSWNPFSWFSGQSNAQKPQSKPLFKTKACRKKKSMKQIKYKCKECGLMTNKGKNSNIVNWNNADYYEGIDQNGKSGIYQYRQHEGHFI